MSPERADLVVVGAGAAGLFASIWAGRSEPGKRIVAFDGAKRLGAKILVAGGGRCNVTHHAVSERDFNGSTPASIRRILSKFGVDATVTFFRALGVELKREETGKLFPVTDDAHTVLNALLGEARRVGVELRHPSRVRSVRRLRDLAEAGATDRASVCGERVDSIRPGALKLEFLIDHDGGQLIAPRVILATGGRALPKSGSDGFGFELARALGHSITPRITAALVPLKVADGHWVRSIPGVSSDAEIVVRDRPGGPIVGRFAGSVLCTHFGLSGPAILDASRHLLHTDGGTLSVRWIPSVPEERMEAWLLEGARETLLSRLRRHLPERLARTLLLVAGIDPATSAHQIPRAMRAKLAGELGAAPIPIVGDRGDTFAEATAGGVPLREVHLETLESRFTPGLHFCGELLDVDGRIGGFNFQWAWASGFVAGCAAIKLLRDLCPIE